MVILDPNHITGVGHGCYGVGESHVGFSIGKPVGCVEVHFSGVVVEERPEDGVGEA